MSFRENWSLVNARWSCLPGMVLVYTLYFWHNYQVAIPLTLEIISGLSNGVAQISFTDCCTFPTAVTRAGC